jgi:gamma-glutamyltranspeptidase/glutathione hydrolase
MRHIRFVLAVVAFAAFAAAPVPAASHATAPYTLTAQALLGGTDVDLYLTVVSAGAPLPDRLEKVQLKALPFAGDHLRTTNYFDVPAPDGVAVLHLTGLDRGRPLHVLAHVKEGNQNNVEAETVVQLRPDLALTPLVVPNPIVRRHPFTVTTTVSEVAGDTGAAAVATLFDGTTPLASQLVTVDAGGSSVVTLTGTLERPPKHTLRVVLSDSVPAEANVANDEASRHVTIWLFTGDVVVTDDAEATAAGVDVLKAGGNAFDAAAAVLFALNATLPDVAGIGGSSNIVIVRPDGVTYAIDARELAPAATTKDTYKGQTRTGLSVKGSSVGVPTNLLAIDEMLRRWGTMTLAQTLQPAIALAEGGIPARWGLTDRNGCLDPRVPLFASPDMKKLCEDAADGTFTQPALGATFRLIAAGGVDAFYRGPVAQAIVDAVRSAPGPGSMTLADLEHASVVVEDPVHLAYRDAFTVLGAPPSTAGGLVTLETLGLIDRFPIGESPDWAFGKANTLHVTLEAMRLAFADRDWFIGDDARVAVPVANMLGNDYLAARGAPISLTSRIPEPTFPGDPSAYAPDPVDPDGVSHTTHVSIIDRWGNVVAMTTTMADSFGSGIVVPGYGFALNDSLALFNLEPRGGVGADPGANDAGPGKRPMGHMSPTIVLQDGEPVVVTGTYGSGFIPSLVLNVLIDVMDHRMSLREAVDAPRIWGSASTGVATWGGRFGPSTSVPDGLDAAEIAKVRALGDRLSLRPDRFPQFGALESAGVDPVKLEPIEAADVARMPGAAGVVVER